MFFLILFPLNSFTQEFNSSIKEQQNTCIVTQSDINQYITTITNLIKSKVEFYSLNSNKVIVRFNIDADGNISKIIIRKSLGLAHKPFNTRIIEAIESSSPLPLPPCSKAISVELTFRYKSPLLQ